MEKFIYFYFEKINNKINIALNDGREYQKIENERFEGSEMYKIIQGHSQQGCFFVGHNIATSNKLFIKNNLNVVWIDTMKIMNYLDEDGELESLSLNYLHDYFDLNVRFDQLQKYDPLRHVRMIVELFHSQILMMRDENDFINHMIELTNQPMLLKDINFGKYKNEKWSKIPKTYLRWIIDQDFNDDVIYTAKYYLK
jgi:hypothetical protein